MEKVISGVTLLATGIFFVGHGALAIYLGWNPLENADNYSGDPDDTAHWRPKEVKRKGVPRIVGGLGIGALGAAMTVAGIGD